MSPLSIPRILGLPNTSIGNVLGHCLVVSFTFSLVQLALTAPGVGVWQYFILLAAGPATIVHHITIFCLLRKHRKSSADSPYLPSYLSGTINIVLLSFFEALWLAGTAVGFYLFSYLHDSTDFWLPYGLGLASNVFGLLESLALGVLIVFCVLGRREGNKSLGRERISEETGP